jgi:hypothetical protein
MEIIAWGKVSDGASYIVEWLHLLQVESFRNEDIETGNWLEVYVTKWRISEHQRLHVDS